MPGSTTVHSTRKGLAPRPAAALARLGFTLLSATPTLSITNGMAITAWPMAIENKVPSRPLQRMA